VATRIEIAAMPPTMPPAMAPALELCPPTIITLGVAGFNGIPGIGVVVFDAAVVVVALLEVELLDAA
jgi:hypothetical protein